MLLTLATIGLITSAQADSSLLRTQAESELMSVPGVELGHSGSYNGKYPSGWAESKARLDRSTVEVRILEAPTLKEMQLTWRSSGPEAIYREPYAAFSGFPIGNSTRRYALYSQSGLESYSGLYFVQVKILYGTGPKTDWKTPQRVKEREACERIVRQCVGQLSIRNAKPIKSLVIRGKAVNAVQDSNGDVLVDLAGYCTAKRIRIKFDGDVSIASITFNRRKITLPLGASGLQIGATWVDSNEVTGLIGKTWFTPLAALKAAIGS